MITKTYTVTWNYKVGDEVWYIHHSDVRKGTIVELKIDDKYGTNVIPCYKIQYNEFGKTRDSYSVEEEKILEYKAVSKRIDKLNKLLAHQDKSKKEWREVRNKVDELKNELRWDR